MKRTLLLIVMVLLVVLAAAGIALAQTEELVDTTGVVSGGAVAPVVQNAFMLPDMNAANGTGVDLIAPYEDLPGTGPVNVTPNLFNDPARFMGFWAFLSSPGGISSINDVWVNVYHPDGTFKYQLHMALQTCESLGTPTTAGTPAAGAVTTGQKTALDFTANPGGIIDQCQQGLLAPYYVAGEITKDQPFGIYTYKIGATSLGGGSVTSAPYTFEVLQISGIAIDFTVVDFGQINPMSMKITDGDAVWGLLPSIASVGNVWLNLMVEYDPMIGENPLDPNYNKVIDKFDLVVGAPTGNPLGQARVDTGPINAEADVTISNFILPPNCPVKLQFSAHPEIMGVIRTATGQTGIPAGTYTGNVELTGVPSATQWTSGWKAALDLCRFDIPRS